jgi:hypothetical protein
MTAEVAALYVDDDDRGSYVGLPGVHVYGISRDARLYDGPWPAVAHPPCDRWGRYWGGGPSAKVRRIKGDDGGCFAAAIVAVEKFNGVLEHPEASHAWLAFGIRRPPKGGGWIAARNGFTCCVEQGHYGHRARKATWLYYVGNRRPPELIWGPSTGERLDEGFHSAAERSRARAAGIAPRPRLTTRENGATPALFRDVLINIARQSVTA